MTEDITDPERTVREQRALIAMLYDELAEHYPVSITTRAYLSDEASTEDLANIVEVIVNGDATTRRAHLPDRIRAVVDGTAVSAHDAQETRIKELRSELLAARGQLEQVAREAARATELDRELERVSGAVGDIIQGIERRIGPRDRGVAELVLDALRTELSNIEHARARPPEWIKVGTVVDYHAVISGPVTSPGLLVRGGPERLPSGEWVVWLKGKAGAVSVRACSRTEVSGG